MTTLLIDNYDSFTYNLYQFLAEIGADVVVKRNGEVSPEECGALEPDHVVISPGPGNPDNAGISKEVVRTFAGKVPVLGVCLGHQSVYEVFGGTVTTAGEIKHGKVSPIKHDGKGIFAGLPQGFLACRYHSLAGTPESQPESLEVSARTDAGIIMGVRHREFTVDGVQFHPESIATEYGKDLLRNFLAMSGGRR